MKTLMTRLAVLCAVALLAGCAHKQDIQSDQVHYTQVGFYQYAGTVLPSNAQFGNFVPPNTQVKLIAASDGSKVESIEIELLRAGQRVIIQNRQDWSGQTIDQLRQRLFGQKPVNTAQFGKQIEEAIQQGRIIKGMPKAAVLMAVGYPPAHKTPSLDDDQWTYWSTKVDRKVVRFASGKVVEIKD
ncbi:outer membrane protein assembly factor BamE (lipoprotein component of BamABCDE complex) [Chitinivorax tropicus]|uniref:Outer membrane protein assembly factor BamE (Lipoprotein component of BamABCDE complex) n=1 Tax=Chitinivorax tropicus TaxID=714531 RepID=A0A840MJT2_9PROT|nr:hypothetical protein [Chitinivorax tropicus]MBB5017429.1 outer membrane protein assembly factor BamE (lipoprotein component of BamABCDE complex) [Chitinivorax tropicus]